MQRRTGQGATHLDPSSHSHSASLLSRWQWLPGCPLFQGSKLSLDLGQWPPTPLTPLHNQSHHETLFSQCHICIISILPEPQQLAAQSNEKSAGFCEYWYKATDWQMECCHPGTDPGQGQVRSCTVRVCLCARSARPVGRGQLPWTWASCEFLLGVHRMQGPSHS